MSVVGVDFGTLNTVIAVARNRGVDVVRSDSVPALDWALSLAPSYLSAFPMLTTNNTDRKRGFQPSHTVSPYLVPPHLDHTFDFRY